MLPEAIAIVMAPKFNQTGFFVLTPNYGLDFIGSCRSDKFY
jgi:STAM-binding protein